jgi:hypothetical protein
MDRKHKFLLSNLSDPAVFSSDDDPNVDNYAGGRPRKRRYIGSWFQQMPTSSDSTFGEAAGPMPRQHRTLERQWDSGVWMESDGLVEPDEELVVEIETPAKLNLPQPQNSRLVPSLTPEELIVRTRIDQAIEDGDPEVDLSCVLLPPSQSPLRYTAFPTTQHGRD